MTATDPVAVLQRVLEEQLREVDELGRALEGLLASSRTGQPQAVDEAVGALAAVSEVAARQQAARRLLWRQHGWSSARVRELIATAPGEAGQRLRATERALRARAQEAVRLGRRLAFVVTQLLRVNGEILGALAAAVDPGVYGRTGTEQGAAGSLPGRVRAEA